MLKGMRKLGLSGINRKNGRAFCSAISNLSRLESLSVSSAGKSGLRGCLDEIYSPPENLQSLKGVWKSREVAEMDRGGPASGEVEASGH